ncbi:tRNA lysidine(34) synthetase TilS [Lentisalinibacter sediminis]|uniref:tRNA lysidine(34) synthetase TilS n=1 Tax=Lentisalinibacter sediminis TaxID=2992237 RepID=UPI00386E8C00
MASSGTAEPPAFGPGALEDTLRGLLGRSSDGPPEAPHDEPLPPLAVAFSGGADSTALLHAAVSLPAGRVRGLHVDHGLQAESAAWAAHCQRAAAALGVECRVLRADITRQAIDAEGVEGAARQARYRLLAAALKPGECLLTAQHRQDQLETVLLQLVRGAGLPGLAAMPAVIAPFGDGRLLRPLLDRARDELCDYLRARGIDWLEDPANTDPRFDRSFLRREIVPRLLTRWPAADRNAARSARHLAEGAGLLRQLASADLDRCDAGEGRLDAGRLRRLPRARQGNALRHWLRSDGCRAPDARHLDRLLEEVVAGTGEQPRLSLGDAEVRRYRDRLYLLRGEPPALSAGPLALAPGETLELPGGLGRLVLRPGAPIGLDPALAVRGCQVRFRSGGESLAPAADRPTRRLKQLLREEGVVPWMRGRLPLVYCGEELVAVADLWMAAQRRCEGGVAVVWEGHPPLY